MCVCVRACVRACVCVCVCGALCFVSKVCLFMYFHAFDSCVSIDELSVFL